jgi:hypothetical protein
MYSTVRPTLAAVAVCLLAASPSLAAQSEAEWKGQAISSVIGYRTAVLGDTATRFDGCAVAQQLGVDPGEVAAKLAQPARGMLVLPCVPVAERGTRKVVLVDSVARGEGGMVKAYITVVIGEWVHREDYSLVLHTSDPPMMAVREVRLWGALQSYPRRPPRHSNR